MMILSSREEEFAAKLDDNDNGGTPSNAHKAASTSSSSWLRSKDPRIVRVSRAFGGKDRHSKVCTVRGLRDRRVRLSVPTAIQLYDLQDRLGLNQPSKVVDWLLNVAKDDIDELPPLQIPPGFNFMDQAHQAMLSAVSHTDNQQVGTTSHPDQDHLGSKLVDWEDAPTELQKSIFWASSSQPRSTKSKQVTTRDMVMNERDIWNKRSDDQEDDHKLETLELGQGGSSSNFFQRSNHSSLPNLLHSVLPYGSCYHLDYPSNFSLSSTPASQPEDHHHHNNFSNVLQLQSTLSVPSGPRVLICPPGMASQSYYPGHVSSNTTPAAMDLDPRQFINHFHILSPSQQQNSLQMSLDDVNKKR